MMVALKEIVEIPGDTINPSKTPNEEFQLFSIPSYDSQQPEFSTGNTILSSKSIVKEGDVLISKLNPRIPRVWLVRSTPNHRSICSTEFIVLRCKKNLDIEPNYLVYMCLSPQYMQPLQGKVRSATKSHERVRPDDILELTIPLPPLPEQKRIVARIQECMEKVQEIERLRAEAVVEADNLLPSLIDASMVQASGKEVSLEDVCSIVSRLVDPKEKKHQSLLHVGGANIESKTSRLIDLQTAAQEKITSGKFLFDDTMVLYNKIRPYLMKVARPEFSGLCSADMYPLKPTNDLISKDYLFYLLMSRHFTDYAIMGSNRAGMPKVNREHLFAYRFILPSRNVQDEITTKLNHGFAASNQLIRQLQESSSETVAIRESILRKAFAGEL